MTRRYTETDRIKFGNMKPVYFHAEYDKPGGKVVDAWISSSTKDKNDEMHALMEAISQRIQEAIASARSL